MNSIFYLRHNLWSKYAIDKRIKSLQCTGKRVLNEFEKLYIKSIEYSVPSEDVNIINRIINIILLYSDDIRIINLYKNDPIFIYFISYSNYKKNITINDIIQFEKVMHLQFPSSLRLKLLLCNYCCNLNLKDNTVFKIIYPFNKWIMNNKAQIIVSENIGINLQLNKYINMQTEEEKEINIEEMLYPLNEWRNIILRLKQKYNIGDCYKSVNDFMYNFIDKQIDKLNYNHAQFLYSFFIQETYNTKYKPLIRAFCRYSLLPDDVIEIILHLYPFFI